LRFDAISDFPFSELATRRRVGDSANSGLLSPAMLHPAPLRRFIWVVIAGSLIGGLYGNVEHAAPVVGALVGGSIGAVLFALERFVRALAGDAPVANSNSGILRPETFYRTRRE
jgi:membrane associated rhomboid family serine protease